MASPPSPLLLLLDDELCWLNRHQQYFQKQGFICIPTLFSEHAIHLGINLESIKYLVIDHVLHDLTQPEDERENQRWQGRDVIREVYRYRNDVKFIIVTQVIGPINRDKEVEKWMRDLEDYGLLDIFHKDQINSSPDRTYKKIGFWFKNSQKKPKDDSAGESNFQDISLQDKHLIEEILSNQAFFQGGSYSYFTFLLQKAGLPEQWIQESQGLWTRYLNQDAVKLVHWAIRQGRNPKKLKYTTLGCILEVVLDSIGEEDRVKIKRIIDEYQLVPRENQL
ncbi:hypothetical protein ACQ4N7_26320 [Nodosilinea sp. AN01ver1]|uniref:hypothetical protein n=1 Tax=Nodosilinea sp. AN01ver1 TaxID=3423362 RepID=UPI003D313996